MYNFYAESIYNLYLKEERKKRNLKLEDLSKSLSFSLGFVSQLENSINILNNDKISVLLTFYGYDKDYLSRFNQTVNKLMSKFCHHLLYMENQMVKESYNEMEEFFSNYKNTSLEQIFLSCKFIYNVYFNDANAAKEYMPPVTNFQYYGEYFLAILNIYIARYHMLCMNYKKSIETLTSSVFNHLVDKNIQGFRYISLSTSYMRLNRIEQALKYCDEAIVCFTNTNNYKRLLNTNIDKGNQILKLRKYNEAISFNKNILTTAISMNYHSEVRAILNNIAYIYIIQNNYAKALECFKEMPTSEMKEKHFCSYVLCLLETENHTEAMTLSEFWIKNAKNPYYSSQFNAFHKYLLTKNAQKFIKDLIKILKTHYNSIDMFEIEYLHVLIAYHYKKLNMYKSAMEYLEKLREIEFCD